VRIPCRRKTATVSVPWSCGNEEDLSVECAVTPGDPGRLYGPPEKCYPPEGPEVDLLAVYDEDGRERRDLLPEAEKDRARIEEAAIEEAEESHAAAYEDACERRAEEAREERWGR
jgi:hypothetical protein